MRDECCFARGHARRSHAHGELAEKGIELIAPHRRNRRKIKTQDERKLRRYERRAENYLGFVKLGCLEILLRYL